MNSFLLPFSFNFPLSSIKLSPFNHRFGQINKLFTFHHQNLSPFLFFISNLKTFSPILQPFDGFVVAFHAESFETFDAGFSREGMVAVWLAFADVGNVYLNNLDADGANAVGKGNGSVGVCPRIHDHGIVTGIGFLQLVDDEAFVVGLKIIDFVLWKTLLEVHMMLFK